MIDSVQQSDTVQFGSQISASMKLPNNKIPNRKTIGLILGALVIALVSFMTGLSVGKGLSHVLGVNDQRADAPAAKAHQTINKEVAISLKNSKNEELTKVKYLVQSAELQDEILIKGQRARAIKGRTFLIIDIKVTNTYTQAIQLNTKDYMRLTINNQTERLAPDIHNDPVQIQAISTKYTRVGFPINDTDKNLVLHVGEINGTKQDIRITF